MDSFRMMIVALSRYELFYAVSCALSVELFDSRGGNISPFDTCSLVVYAIRQTKARAPN